LIEVESVPHPPTGSALIPVGGLMRMCMFNFEACAGSLDLPLTRNSGQTGFGVGGVLTAGRFGGLAGWRVSIYNAPWTLGTGTAINQTAGGGFVTLTRTGFVHDAASGTGSTAQISGVIQLITPSQMVTVGFPGNMDTRAVFGVLTLHFIPEPGLLLLLGSGVVGLALIGGRRMRK
jgi:hypothetical protein